MSVRRTFRISVQEHHAQNAAQWRDRARALEAMGYATLYLPDHFGQQVGPVAGLMAAADATTTLRIGSLVFDNDYRHPAVLAKEAASLDLLSEGRFDFGIGAGWMISDYEQTGMAYDPPGTRIARLAEALTIIKKFFAGGEFSFEGDHYTIKGLEGSPQPVQRPHPPIVLGGGGRKMLELAVREADTINVNFDLREGRRGANVARTGLAEATDEKLSWIREAAGERLTQVELGVWILQAFVTDERETVASRLSPLFTLEAADVLASPHVLIGTVEQIAADLVARRERYGISHIVVPGDAADSLAPVVERLAGT
ncbi:MAG TPA: TIGR03621 family F420-dependent LLM class oxidoreductase [Candidatus Dormibacteraeota bacterium]|nr:TIGR03621 family F420-dependent LLM class oxidoreductase [Candidatus Dormibacteraeota bacterium]